MQHHRRIIERKLTAARKEIFIEDLYDDRARLVGVLPDLGPFLQGEFHHAERSLAPRVKAAYAELRNRPKDFSTQDEALAYVLVQLPLLGPPRPDPYVPHSNKHLAEQFDRPFQGNAHRRFLSFIVRTRNDFNYAFTKPYYYGTPIIQSSGTGKTRMVLELRNHAPLLYLCLRKPSAPGDARASYPLADPGVLEYFAGSSRSFNFQIACFLAAWFSQLAHEFAEIEAEARKTGS